MSNETQVNTNYEDVPNVKTDPGMAKLVSDLDAMGRATPLPPGLMQSIGIRLMSTGLPATSQPSSRTRLMDVRRSIVRVTLAFITLAALLIGGSRSGVLADVLAGHPFSGSTTHQPSIQLPPACPLVDSTHYQMWSLGSYVNAQYLDINLQNTGKDIRHFVLAVNSRNSWTLKSIVASMTPAQDDKDMSLIPHVLASSRGMYTWDFGQLRSCASVHAHLAILSSAFRSLSDSMTGYAEVGPDGQPDKDSVVFGGEDTLGK